MNDDDGLKLIFPILMGIIMLSTFIPFMWGMITDPIATMNRTQEVSDYYKDPDYFTITGKLVKVDFIESGNWPLKQKLTQVQLDSGEIIFVKEWKRGLILMQKYEFGYTKTYSGKYDLEYPDYIKHIPSGEMTIC